MNTTTADRVTDVHQNASNLIAWLSLPGVGERYGLEVPYLITMFKMCMGSPTPGEAINDIDVLIEYIQYVVKGQG